MPRKGKPMPIELQKRIIKKIVLKRGNSQDTGAIDMEAVFDNLDSTYTLPENISNLEIERYLLPKNFESIDEYYEKRVLAEQKEMNEAEEKESN